MQKTIKAICVLIIIMSIFFLPNTGRAKTLLSGPNYSTASELIDAVNALRTANGLAPYQANPILMSIAQAQAEYLLSIGTYTHADAQGRLPYQRALDAGYPVAGNITTSVGFFSENIGGGVGQTAEGEVQVWMGDEAHKNTMLSGTLQDIGAGVASSGDTFYYVIDAGLSTGGTPVAYTPRPPLNPSTPAIIPNTPNADGSITHVVVSGDTLGSLSLAYHVPLSDIRKLNNLTKDTIYVGQKIIVQAAFTPTPTQPTSTPTLQPTSTPWPTSTQSPTVTPPPPTPTPAPGMAISAAGGAVGIIATSALILAGLLVFLGRRRK